MYKIFKRYYTCSLYTLLLATCLFCLTHHTFTLRVEWQLILLFQLHFPSRADIEGERGDTGRRQFSEVGSEETVADCFGPNRRLLCHLLPAGHLLHFASSQRLSSFDLDFYRRGSHDFEI